MNARLSVFAFACLAAAAAAQETVRVSVATGGVQLPGATGSPSISGDGRYVVFSTNSPVLTGGAGQPSQVFVHDRDPDGNGTFDEGNSVTYPISVTATGLWGNGASGQASISDDGRWVAFATGASNFSSHTWVAGGFYLLDRDSDQNGVFDELPNAYYAIRAPGNLAPNASLGEFDVPPGGAFVTFTSNATNLVTGDLNGQYDVFRWERATGTIERASVSTAGVEGDRISRHPRISDDGNLVVFETQSSTLFPGASTFGGDVALRDFAAGTTAAVSVSSTGALGVGLSLKPDISGDGQFVAFVSYANNFDPRDTGFDSDVYLRDLAGGETELVSVDSFGNKGTGGSTDCDVSHDGTRVQFASLAPDLWWNDVNFARDVFVRDRVQGWTRQVSVATDGEHGNAASGEGFGLDFASGGGHSAFYSDASNLVAGDTNNSGDLFAHSVCDGGVELGFATAGQQGLVPELRACGSLASGSQGMLRLVNARPNHLGAAFVSTMQVNNAIWGGTLVPGSGTILRFTTDAEGKALLSFPGGGGPGTVYAQVLVRDGAAPGSVGFSNALALPLLP